MSLIASHDPCVFGPDIAGLSAPTRLWALVPDHEHNGKPSQACDCFAAGQTLATAVLMDPTQATQAFNALAASLIKSREKIDAADAYVLVGLWRMPNDAIMLVAVDLEGGFASEHIGKVLEGLPYPVSKSNMITASGFDAAQVSQSPAISRELSYALKFFSS